MKHLFFLFLYFISISSIALTQPVKKKTAPPVSQAAINKMMENAMKAEGMTKEEIEEAKKIMGQAGEIQKQASSAGYVPGVSNSISLTIPARQTTLLAKIPMVKTQEQLNQYMSLLLTECKKNIPASITNKCDQLLALTKTNTNELSATAIALFLNRNIKPAIYTALKAYQLNPADPLVQNNAGFILQQAGYPQKAIPVFRFLTAKYNTADHTNNLAQSYLSLGEKAEATKLFMAGLAINPTHSEMNCGMALLHVSNGNIAAATLCLTQSIKNGFSRTAEEIAKKHKITLPFKDVRSKAPEYFNPYKFKPAPPAGSMEEIPQVFEEREATKERYETGHRKMEEFNVKYQATLEKGNLGAALQQHIGYLGTTALARKAFYMVQLIQNERYDFYLNKLDADKYKATADEYRKEFEEEFNRIQSIPFDNDAQRCKAHVDNLNAYLKKTKENYNNYEKHVLPKIYDYLNQSLYWQSFLLNGDAYQSLFLGEVQEFYNQLDGFQQMQNLYPTPEYIYTHCKNYKEELEQIKLEQMLADLSCPVSMKLPMGKAASFKMNCKGMEIEGGELLKLGFERNSQTGEFALAFGLGADISTGVLNAGAKGMMYFKFDKDFSPIDMGLKGEAGADVQLGPFNIDEKLSGTMGIASVSVDAVHLGKEYNVFSVDATKD